MAVHQQRDHESFNQAGNDGNSPPEQDWRRVTTVAHDIIARCAYQLYERRGREPGHELDDWLQAEHEVQQRLSNE